MFFFNLGREAIFFPNSLKPSLDFCETLSNCRIIGSDVYKILADHVNATDILLIYSVCNLQISKTTNSFGLFES